MIDLFAVVSFGGLVHWKFTSHEFDYSTLLDTILFHLSTHSDPDSCNDLTHGPYSLKWHTNSELGLIFVVAHPKMFPLPWATSLLKRMESFVVRECGESLQNDPFVQLDLLAVLKESIKREETKAKQTQSQAKTNSKPKPQITEKKNSTSDTRRSWNDKVNKDELETLDYSSSPQTSLESPTEEPNALLSISAPSKVDEASDVEGDEEGSSKESVSSSSWWQSFKSLTGNAPLSLDDLAPALKAMKMHLVGKNVAGEVADTVVGAVGNKLQGQIPGTFASISKLVHRATHTTLQSILTPSKPVDLLNEITRHHNNNAPHRPFVMAFIGVNGVGKSTNLAKVAYWLLQHDLRVLLVAGDTFRAGAVEQLKQHCRNLSMASPGNISIFERGYGKDPATIAQEAIKYAQQNNFHIVLIDTAGRMQDNGPLMIALAKLINMNRPNRVIFVGEALVGHDALSQLQKFNGALLDHSAKPIDGILLTKVDIIDDKIGAALSMTITAKAPILFMGVGQTYTDLRRINIKQVVDLLLK